MSTGLNIGSLVSYEYDPWQTFLNWSVLLATSVSCGLVSESISRKYLVFFGISLLIFASVQALIWYEISGTNGISVVWAANVGFNLISLVALTRNKYRNMYEYVPQNLRGWFVLSTMYAFGIIGYYAIVEVPITTVAHICAIVMGMLLAVIACLIEFGVRGAMRIGYNSGEREPLNPMSRPDTQTVQ
jgi:hypothetical protein